MIIHGRSFREHVNLLWPLLSLIAAVWVLRMVLGFVGVPRWFLHWTSVTLATALAIFLVALLIYARRFGGYTNVVFSVFVLAVWEQLLIAAAVAFAAVTGTHNIYSAPEFSPLGGPLQHIIGHLTIGIGFQTLFGSAMGCGLYFLVSRIMPTPSAPKA